MKGRWHESMCQAAIKSPRGDRRLRRVLAVAAEIRRQWACQGFKGRQAWLAASTAAQRRVRDPALESVPVAERSPDPAPARARMAMGYELYTTGAPCPMCMGAIYMARLDRVHHSCGIEAASKAGFSDAFLYEDLAKPESERLLQMRQIHPEFGEHAYREWSERPDRHLY